MGERWIMLPQELSDYTEKVDKYPPRKIKLLKSIFAEIGNYTPKDPKDKEQAFIWVLQIVDLSIEKTKEEYNIKEDKHVKPMRGKN
jgi:hypothetical protein